MTLSSHFVSPSNIQNELNKIWESFETKTVTRACLFNLIFYTHKNHRTHYIERITQAVVEKFPSRVIFVTINKDAKEDYLKTAVSILPSSKGEFDVACDYIHIETGGSYQERVPFVVLPHILPDLPVYLVWAEDPNQEDPTCHQLEQFVDRLIFDSESSENLAHFATNALKHYEKSQSDIADLNWARIEDWRDVFSMTFHSDEKLKKIESAQKIAIQYNSQETPFFCHTRIQAMYLQLWLACQLNWEFDAASNDKNTSVFKYKGRSGPIEITLSAVQEAKLPPGLILSAEIQTAQNESFSFKRNAKLLHQITFEHSTSSQCDLPFHYVFTKVESGHSLVKEICHRGTSEHYLKVLNLLKKMEKSVC